MVVFHSSLDDSKSFLAPLLSILADFNNAVVWMVSIVPLISNSFSNFSMFYGLFQVHQLQIV